jgi:hypothetical protein
MFQPSKANSANKTVWLAYFRDRAAEISATLEREFGTNQHDKQTSAMNRRILQDKDGIIKALLQIAEKESWSKAELLSSILLITYASYVVMIDARNEIWLYDYMSFSRRMGELWEPFCKLCFDYPINEVKLFVPPLFSQVKQMLRAEVEQFIDTLAISDGQRIELKKYYEKAWKLVASGEIQLTLDLHFEIADHKFVVDFKSGFGSNEKGNTNRLLLVATVYSLLPEKYHCLLFVRSEAEENNNYFNVLRNSGIWQAYCGTDTYDKIKQYSGFDLKKWIEANIDWAGDLKGETLEHLNKNSLSQYFRW